MSIEQKEIIKNIKACFSARVIDNILLTDDGSSISIRHLELEPSISVDYNMGDLLAIEKEGNKTYPISSSPSLHNNKIHIVAKTLELEGNDYLSSLDKGSVIECELVSNKHFRLASFDSSIIMISSGVGIAPFRAFLQNRVQEELEIRKATKENKDKKSKAGRNWLFFANPRFKTDFLYQRELHELLDEGIITKLSLAFSVEMNKSLEDCIRESGSELFKWIEQGAYVYVSGAGNALVEKEILNVITDYGNLSAGASDDYLNELKSQKRYLENIY